MSGSRFANRAATGRLVLPGGCKCPDTPHDEDWIDLRTELGTSDVLAIAEGNSVDTLARLIVAWNLLDNEGQPAPVDREHIGDLYADSFQSLNAWIEDHVSVQTLPNGFGAPSRNGSRASASSRRGRATAR